MKTEILPQESPCAEAFSLWMSSPMPMVTLVKTMDGGHAARFLDILQKEILLLC